MTRILIVTDSTCDVPPDWIRRYDIRLVPTYVHFGQQSLADNGVELVRADFYARLAIGSPFPTTAAPSVGEVTEVMARALAEADHVIGITAVAKLSGLYNTFRLAAEQTDPRRVTLIDSQMTSMGLGWQVVIAAEMIEAGAAPGDIKAAIVALQPRIDVWAALDTMQNLRRSGRVSWARAFVGDLLQIKPLIRLHQGVVTSVVRTRTSQRGFDALVKLAHKAAPLDRLAVLHTTNLARVGQLVAALADIWPPHEVAIMEATPVLGVHVGPNGIGLAVVRRE